MPKFTATALAVLSTICVLSFSAPAQAAVISSTVPEYNGAFEDPSLSYPLPSVLIGTFSYTIPAGDHITGATISGAFGNLDQANTSALSHYFVGSVEVAACDSTSDPCFSADINDPPPRGLTRSARLNWLLWPRGRQISRSCRPDLFPSRLESPNLI